MNEVEPSDWLTETEAGELLRLSTHGLRHIRYSGKGPRFHKFGRFVRYHRVDLAEWISAQAVDPSPTR